MAKTPLAAKHFCTIDQAASMCAKAVEMAAKNTDEKVAQGKQEIARAFELRLQQETFAYRFRAGLAWLRSMAKRDNAPEASALSQNEVTP